MVRPPDDRFDPFPPRENERSDRPLVIRGFIGLAAAVGILFLAMWLSSCSGEYRLCPDGKPGVCTTQGW